MRVADSDRARIPFALVAVLLLLGSATYAATMGHRRPGGSDPDPGAAIDRAESATRTVLVRAVDRAARRAGRSPVLTPANTTYGRVLSNATPFRDYLKVRIYLSARRSLARTHQTVDDVRVNASLPAVGNASDLRRAIERVTLAENGSTLEVGIDGLRFRAVRAGETLLAERRSLRVAVENPVLSLHDLTETFQHRLNSRHTTLRFTALMYSVAYARGYLQRGGFPIENVVTNRHAELMANAAVQATQRSVFGRSDPEGRRAFRRALLQVGLRDVMAPSLGPQTRGWLGVVLGSRPSPLDASRPVTGPAPSLTMPDLPSPSPEDEMTVGVNGTADLAFAKFLRGDTGPSFATLVNRTYDTLASVVTEVERTRVGDVPEPDPPGPGWTLTNTTESVARTVHEGPAPRPETPRGWHAHESYERHVVVEHNLTRRWERDGEHVTTNASYEDHYRVGLLVADDHAFSRNAPDNPIAVVHEPGGPLNGQNLRWTPPNATRTLITDRGGPGALARRIVAGNRNHTDFHGAGVRPQNLTRWVYLDLARLRDRVRNVTVDVERGDLATNATAQGKLADALLNRRRELLDAPDVYRSVADKVRVNARGAYLDRVIAALERRARLARRSKQTVDDELSERDLSTDRAESMMRNRQFESDEGSSSETTLQVTVDAAPSYLPLRAVDHGDVASVAPGRRFHALVAENVNLFTIPYEDAARAANSGNPGSERRNLRSIASTLKTADRYVTSGSNESLRTAYRQVRTGLNETVSGFVERLAEPLSRSTDLNRTERVATIRSGLDRYDGTAGRALALANGSAADPLVGAVDRRSGLSPAVRDWLRMRFRLLLAEGVTDRRTLPSRGVVSRLTRDVGRLANRASTNYVANRLEDVRNRYAGSLRRRLRRRWNDKYDDILEEAGAESPASIDGGLPVLPSPPGYYFTMNVWVVNVGGRYARFTVRSPTSGPSGESVAYTRDGDAVILDVDGDGNGDRLGNATRVSFSTQTVVVVVVPPGPPGIGDTNGRMFERSPGWCTPGPEAIENDSSGC